MARVTLNPVVERLRGKIGDLVFKRTMGGNLILARRPDRSNTPLSDAQKAVHEKFRQASIYGRTVLADPVARAAYEQVAKSRKKPLFSLMIADFFLVPKVNEIDLSNYQGQIGDVIGIRVNDDFDVATVNVKIMSTGGSLLEQGPAVKSESDGLRWFYMATTDIPDGQQVNVEVTATDRPGNKGSEDGEHVICAHPLGTAGLLRTERCGGLPCCFP